MKMENVQAEIVVCEFCGQVIDRNDCVCYGANGETCCESCFEERFMCCDRCGELVDRDDAIDVVTHYYGYSRCERVWESWCPCCADDHAIECDDCGNMVDEDLVHYVGANDRHVCGVCLDANYTRCDYCGEYVHCNDAITTRSGDTVCGDCYDAAEDDDRVIHGYHSGVRPLLWNTDKVGDIYDLRRNTLFVGVELEIAFGGCCNSNAARIIDAGGYAVDESVVCEEDGSLRNGFELISTTADVDWHVNHYGWREMMQTAIGLGYTSHNAGCCGLHIHMDRRYFEGSFIDPEELATLILVNNKDWLIPFSRRTYFGYCEFPSTDVKFTAAKFEQDKDSGTTSEIDRLRRTVYQMSGHGRALNFDGYATIEIRFNRGTLKFSTFVATLQFAQLYADAIKFSPTLESACGIDLNWFIERASRRQYKEFLEYLVQRGIVQLEQL